MERVRVLLWGILFRDKTCSLGSGSRVVAVQVGHKFHIPSLLLRVRHTEDHDLLQTEGPQVSRGQGQGSE